MMLPVEIDSSLLPADTWAALSGMAPELTHAYAVRQIFRTETEARVSVLDEVHFPTPAAKYWQSVREQCVMLEQLALLSFEYRRNEVAIKRHTRALEAAADDLDREEVQIALDECQFRRASMRTTAADRAREICMWSKIKGELSDGSFDTDDVDAHQLVSYTMQFALRASMVDMATLSPGERDNLAGLLRTSLRRCHARGVIGEVMAALPPKAVRCLEGLKLGLGE